MATPKKTQKLPKKKYKLNRKIPKIGDKSYAKGDSIELTEKGAKYFKSLNRI